MCTYYLPASGSFIPSLHVEPKTDKLPLHVRGRIVLAGCFLAWTPVAIVAWNLLR